jgi:hypothetical protein
MNHGLSMWRTPALNASSTLTFAGVDPVAHILLESLLAAPNVAQSPLPNLPRAMAGGLHVLVAKLADHCPGLPEDRGGSGQRRMRRQSSFANAAALGNVNCSAWFGIQTGTSAPCAVET